MCDSEAQRPSAQARIARRSSEDERQRLKLFVPPGSPRLILIQT